MTMPTLDDYINQVKTLPPAPRVLSELLSLLREHDTHSGRIVELVTYDPALTVKVLRRCNSAAAGAAHPVHDLPEAVTRLGFDEIYRLVATVVGESMLGSAQRGYGIATGELWQHSVTVALAARIIAQSFNADENLAFTAGLLHDIGKLVLSGSLEGAYDKLVEETGTSGHSFLEAEKAILGVEHAEVGGRLLERWKFPEYLVKAIWHHHDPLQARPHERLAAYVYVSDMIAHCLGQGHGHQAFAVRDRSETLEMLEIGAKDFETLTLQTALVLEKTNPLITTAP
jgi:putative nucleotidyltransferase with HDIG domain